MSVVKVAVQLSPDDISLLQFITKLLHDSKLIFWGIENAHETAQEKSYESRRRGLKQSLIGDLLTQSEF